ncbi:MAG: PIN domain-containing protein [Moraxellaceae bacterium]|nr:PIN domain-containing protein [Moraxellaceae bacterium]
MIFNQLQKQEVVYVDTNFLIYLLEGRGELHEQSKQIFQHLIIQETLVISSELTYMETMVQPIKQNNLALIEKYEQLFDSFVTLKPITLTILKQATQYRANTIPKQKTPDAIQVATAVIYQADWFISADKGIKNLPNNIKHYVI